MPRGAGGLAKLPPHPTAAVSKATLEVVARDKKRQAKARLPEQKVARPKPKPKPKQISLVYEPPSTGLIMTTESVIRRGGWHGNLLTYLVNLEQRLGQRALLLELQHRMMAAPGLYEKGSPRYEFVEFMMGLVRDTYKFDKVVELSEEDCERVRLTILEIMARTRPAFPKKRWIPPEQRPLPPELLRRKKERLAALSDKELLLLLVYYIVSCKLSEYELKYLVQRWD